MGKNAGAASTTVLTAPIQSTGRRPIRWPKDPVSWMHNAMATRTGVVSSVPSIASYPFGAHFVSERIGRGGLRHGVDGRNKADDGGADRGQVARLLAGPSGR